MKNVKSHRVQFFAYNSKKLNEKKKLHVCGVNYMAMARKLTSLSQPIAQFRVPFGKASKRLYTLYSDIHTLLKGISTANVQFLVCCK